ncbi:MAG: C40 family peptidase, partial [Parasporobacterium sp.]|nr:C40 family peptidase [Parasporobacterium sp.]
DWYCVNGQVDFTANGIYDGTIDEVTAKWVVSNGRVDTEFTGFVKDTKGVVWYAQNGKIDLSYTNLPKGTVNGETGWWYVKNGKVTYSTGLVKNNKGYWYIKNGKIDLTYYGFFSNSKGDWYIQRGKLVSDMNGIVNGTVNGVTADWYVKDGKVDYSTGIAKTADKWSYVKDGKVLTTYNGFVKSSNSYWYFVDGVVDFNLRAIIYGTVFDNSDWWYVEGNKVLYPDPVMNDEYINIIKEDKENTIEIWEDSFTPPVAPDGYLGSQIVEYAKAWVGVTPYVDAADRWVEGEGYSNSLVYGTDCSGFTYLIFGNFGIYVPTASDLYQTSVGKQITYGELLPGDIIVYRNGGHVAIYAGDDMIVHCSNPERGTVYDNMWYATPTAYIRVI